MIARTCFYSLPPPLFGALERVQFRSVNRAIPEQLQSSSRAVPEQFMANLPTVSEKSHSEHWHCWIGQIQSNLSADPELLPSSSSFSRSEHSNFRIGQLKGNLSADSELLPSSSSFSRSEHSNFRIGQLQSNVNVSSGLLPSSLRAVFGISGAISQQFRAVSELFQSNSASNFFFYNFSTVSEQFQSSFTLVFECDFKMSH